MSNQRVITRLEKAILMCVVSVALLDVIVGCAGSQREDKVSKDRASLRVLATAIESYVVEWNTYPADLNKLTVKAVFDPPVAWLSGRMVSEMGPFIEQIPHSAFDKDVYPKYFRVGEDRCWFAWYPGPDGDFDLNLTNRTEDVMAWWENVQENPAPIWVMAHIYDPTNGTLDGDIIRWKR